MIWILLCQSEYDWCKYSPIWAAAWRSVRYQFVEIAFYLKFESQQVKIWRKYGNLAKSISNGWLVQKCTFSKRCYNICCLVNASVMNQTGTGNKSLIKCSYAYDRWWRIRMSPSFLGTRLNGKTCRLTKGPATRLIRLLVIGCKYIVVSADQIFTFTLFIPCSQLTLVLKSKNKRKTME